MSLSHYLQTGIYLFAFLCVLFIPFPFIFFPFQEKYTQFLFGGLIQVIAPIAGIEKIHSGISSDSTSLYFLLLLLLILSGGLSFLFEASKRWRVHRGAIFILLRKVFSYYLALQLLKYGVDKIFKAQFYLPEPNILYTPFGQLSKDILYWSTIGTSYLYNVITGCVEVLAALLLLFQRTRVVGLLLSIGVMINIVTINIGFDISVKLYSCFLLLLALIALSPQVSLLYQFFILQKPAALTVEDSPVLFPHQALIQRTLKLFISSLFFLEALYPYRQRKTFNDDLVARPFLHGAYQVQTTSRDSVMQNPFSSIKRFFIHRNGYIIFQDQADQMKDFKLQIDSASHVFVLTDYTMHQTQIRYEYNKRDSLLILHYKIQDKLYIIQGKALNWKSLPALKDEIHWTIESN
ncbi:hypothetical protein [Xanthocytophaga agilis]|uniref:DoxX family protein n=1 Tax=Xanthocytophaga agilis TaxID=3048010 RepID=A0AAE3R4I7_9BACT|nr:hypothetical protein [Xanthocytophaga agilis]MDJ1501394.1 hypothetical protein [Xanthocytophaga agilis]